MEQQDHFTTRFPQRNAVVILILLVVACALGDPSVLS
jgi:hypothetical protein